MGMLLLAKEKFVAATKKFFSKKEEGASLVEYGLLVALIAVACIAAITLLGGSIANLFNGVASTINNVPKS